MTSRRFWPSWAKAIIINQEQIMSDIANLNQTITDLQAEVGNIGTQMDTLFAALKAAQAGGNAADIQTATANIQAQIDALKTIATRDTP